MKYKIGDTLKNWSFSVIQENMNLWAEILDDPNPIHLDVNSVKSIGLGEKTINQGQANIAYIINAIDQNFPNSEIIRLNNKMTDSPSSFSQLIVGGAPPHILKCVETTERRNVIRREHRLHLLHALALVHPVASAAELCPPTELRSLDKDGRASDPGEQLCLLRAVRKKVNTRLPSESRSSSPMAGRVTRAIRIRRGEQASRERRAHATGNATSIFSGAAISRKQKIQSPDAEAAAVAAAQRGARSFSPLITLFMNGKPCRIHQQSSTWRCASFSTSSQKMS